MLYKGCPSRPLRRIAIANDINAYVLWNTFSHGIVFCRIQLAVAAAVGRKGDLKMSAPASLTHCDTEKLSDFWSANDQMDKVIRDLFEKTNDETLCAIAEDLYPAGAYLSDPALRSVNRDAK